MASERKLVRMLQAMSAASSSSQAAVAGTGGGQTGAGTGGGAGGGGGRDTGFLPPATASSVVGGLTVSMQLASLAGDDTRPWTPGVNNDPKVHHNNVRVSSTLNRAQDNASVRTPRSHDADSDEDGVDSDDGKGPRLESRADIKKRARKRYQDEQRKRDVRHLLCTGTPLHAPLRC